MSAQPKALALAETLERPGFLPFVEQAAAELRRLHAVNVELLEALLAIYDRHNAETMAKARAAIAKATGGAS